MLYFTVPRKLASELAPVKKKVLRAGTTSMKITIKKAEGIAKRSHHGIAGWKNESTNLQRTITGYVAGVDDPYKYAGTIIIPKAGSHWKGNRIVNNQQYLNDHYRIDKDVSPPIAAVPDEVIGVLHHYMQYSNRLPGSGKQKGVKEIATETLIQNQELLFKTLSDNIIARL